MATPQPGANVNPNDLKMDFQEVKSNPIVERTFGLPRFHTEGDVCAVAFVADGTLRSIDESGALMHWTADGRPLRRTFLSDIETLWSFSPDADMLVSGNDDLLLWDAADGQLIARLVQPSWVTAIGFNPDGTVVASGHDDGSVRFWNPRTQRLTGEISAHRMGISAIVFSPHGDMFATAGEDRVVRVWHVITHEQIAELVSHTDRVPSLTWSADGQLLVSAGWDTSARVWKAGQSLEPLMLLNSHADQVLLCGFAPSGELLATVDSEHEIRLWSRPASAEILHVLRGHIDEVRCIAFDRTGGQLATGGADRVIHLWDTKSGQLLAGRNPCANHGIAYTGGTLPRLASTGGTSLRFWTIATGDEVLPFDNGPAYSVACSSDGRWLAVGGTDHFTRLYDLTKPDKTPRFLEATKPPIGGLAFSADGQLLVQSSPADGLVWLWNTTTAETELILIEAADGCTLETVAVHPNGLQIAAGGVDYLSTGDRDGAVCIWDRTTKKRAMTFDTGVHAVTFDPKGRFLAGAGLDGNVYLWDLAAEKEVFALEGNQERLHAVAFSPDGSYLLSGGDDMIVRVWDVLSGRLIVAREFDSAIHGLVFSDDGSMLYTANENTTCHEIEFAKLLEN